MKGKKKVINNILIIALTVISVMLLFKLSGRQFLPLYILSIALLIYLIWAFVFHKLDKSLTSPIFIEYLLTALLALVLLSGVLF